MKMVLSAIIVVFNHKNYLERCLNSLVRELKNIGESEIRVIDNHSTDGSTQLIKRQFGKKVKLVCHKENLGFARACNKGIRAAKGKYILILNPDTEITRGSLKSMINALEKESIGCLVPRLINPDGSLQYSIRRFPRLITVIARRTPLRLIHLFEKQNEFHLMKDVDHSQMIAIDWALGGCVLTKRQIFGKIGYFDEKFFLYCEDIDWFYRLRKQGLTAFYYPKASIIHHHIAKSDKKLLSRESFYHFKSLCYFFKKYFPEIVSLKYPLK